jgi:hypothetical protein
MSCLFRDVCEGRRRGIAIWNKPVVPLYEYEVPFLGVH